MGEKGLRKNAKRVAWDALRWEASKDMRDWSARRAAYSEAYRSSGASGYDSEMSDWDRQHPEPDPQPWELSDERGYNTETHQNAAWDEDKGCWIDTKTLKPLTPPLLVEQ